MNDLLGGLRVSQAAPEVRLHRKSLAALQIRSKPTCEVLLPAHPKGGISIAGLGQFELDDAIEHRLAVVGRGRMAPAAFYRERPERKNAGQEKLERSAHGRALSPVKMHADGGRQRGDRLAHRIARGLEPRPLRAEPRGRAEAEAGVG